MTQLQSAQHCVILHLPVLQSHEFAPMLHNSYGVDESAETRESVIKKRRVDDDMEISAIETLTNAKLEVDRALHTANKTLHRLLDECTHESLRQSPKLQSSTA